MLICPTLLVRKVPDTQAREKGVENTKNKRKAELVTLALIIYGTLSSHLSQHIETSCVCDSVCLERLLALIHLPIPTERDAQEAP